MANLTVSRLSEAARTQIGAELNARLADTLALYAFCKVAHWNLKGPGFGSLHPLFGELADQVAEYADQIAERGAALGVLARATPRIVAQVSTLPDYPVHLITDLSHVVEVAKRLAFWLDGLRSTRVAVRNLGDQVTENFLLDLEFKAEKAGWQLVSHVQPNLPPAVLPSTDMFPPLAWTAMPLTQAQATEPPVPANPQIPVYDHATP